MNGVKVFKVRREWTCLAALLTATCCFAQSDPGPRGGAAGAGTAIGGLTPGELDFFNNHGIPQFSQMEAVADGLGPRFNLDSCGGCHIQPALGGSSPAVNPQLARASTMAPGNTVPSFITSSGPFPEARFIRRANGSPDGGVHDIFTIAGRADKPIGCAIQQPDFAAQQANHNVIFRIPTPTFGAGLIEAISDTTIRNNLASDPGGVKAGNGIKGHVNTNGNDGTVTRFGWKAQNKSLLIFSGEAYNVEMGISNKLFQTEREEDQNCQFKPAPNDATNPEKDKLEILSDIEKFASFMRLLAPPVPSTDNPGGAVSIANGRKVFEKVGCHLCHTQMLHTTKFKDCDKSAIPQLCGQPV